MNWEHLLIEAWQHHRGKLLGIVLGLVFGLITAALGFWKALFIALCVTAGYVIGKRVDERSGIHEFLERIFKDK